MLILMLGITTVLIFDIFVVVLAGVAVLVVMGEDVGVGVATTAGVVGVIAASGVEVERAGRGSIGTLLLLILFYF